MAAKCSRCATIAVPSEGNVCADCKRKDAEAAKKLLDDLKKKKGKK